MARGRQVYSLLVNRISPVYLAKQLGCCGEELSQLAVSAEHDRIIAFSMLMQGETLRYTPNFSIQLLLDFGQPPRSYRVGMMRIIGGEISMSSKEGTRVD